MSIPKITTENILKVKEVFDTYTNAPIRGRTAIVLPLVEALTEVERWLYSLSFYLSYWTKKWQGVDFSRYYVIPPGDTQVSTFDDMLDILRIYRNQRLTSRNEKEFVQFLRNCVPAVRDFYELILSEEKPLKSFFHNEALRQHTDISQVRPEDIYGDKTFFKEGFRTVSYPVMITTVPNKDLPLAVIGRKDRAWWLRKFRLDKFNKETGRTVLHKNWLKTDRPNIHTTNFALVGLIDEPNGAFYPLDYFETTQEYQNFRVKKKHPVPYLQRLENLNNFLNQNYLRQIKRLPRIICTTKSQVPLGVAKALLGSTHDTVVVCDGRDRLMFSQTYELDGIIGGLWKSEVGEVLGINVWNNGREVPCTFDFSGENHALLYNPDLIVRKKAKFFLFEYRNFVAGAIKEIQFDAPIYSASKIKFRDGKEGYVERCPYCLLEHTKQFSQGICENTAKNWYSTFTTQGPDRWFPVTRKILKRREETRWRPEFFNNVNAMFKHYRVVANENGEIMFKTVPEGNEIYERRKQVGANSPFKVKYETHAELYEVYARRNKIKERKYDTGAVCPARQPDEPEAVADAGGQGNTEGGGRSGEENS